MPWFRVDDTLDTHPKAIAAGNEALGLWVRCGAYASRHLTDGFIPQEIAYLYGSEALVDALVKAKLWRRTRGGWQMHDYLGYNPTKTMVEAQRKNNAERQNRWREARGRRPRNAVTNAVTNASPSHPIPKDPLTPAPSAGEHAGQHPNCRACGTNPRGRPPDPPPTPTPPPVAEVMTVNGRPLRGRAVAAIAAQARQAITKEAPDVPD